MEAREEGGTPNIVGALRAALAFQIQSSLGVDRMHAISAAYTMRAINAFSSCPALRLHGSSRSGYWSAGRLPIISFNVLVRRPGDDEQQLLLHPHFVAAVLNDVYGIQVGLEHEVLDFILSGLFCALPRLANFHHSPTHWAAATGAQGACPL
jgi:selenocysteine lyase/cysteine desulfurase